MRAKESRRKESAILKEEKAEKRDLPEVIAFRRNLIPEPANNRYLAASLLETEWMDNLKKRHLTSLAKAFRRPDYILTLQKRR